MSGPYERELRSVLAGERKGVLAITRSCNEVERARAMQVCERPFLVVRAPGSGSEGTGDLLVLRGDVCFPIEVKSSKTSKIYLSGRTMTQYEAFKETGERCGLLPLYAFRLKGVRGDSWRILSVPVDGLSGKMRLIANRVPNLPLTRNGAPHSGLGKWYATAQIYCHDLQVRWLERICHNYFVSSRSIRSNIIRISSISRFDISKSIRSRRAFMASYSFFTLIIARLSLLTSDAIAPLW